MRAKRCQKLYSSACINVLRLPLSFPNLFSMQVAGGVDVSPYLFDFTLLPVKHSSLLLITCLTGLESK